LVVCKVSVGSLGVEAQPDNSKAATRVSPVKIFIAPVPGEALDGRDFPCFPQTTELVIDDDHYYPNE
jgi:hypothetical protein